MLSSSTSSSHQINQSTRTTTTAAATIVIVTTIDDAGPCCVQSVDSCRVPGGGMVDIVISVYTVSFHRLHPTTFRSRRGRHQTVNVEASIVDMTEAVDMLANDILIRPWCGCRLSHLRILCMPTIFTIIVVVIHKT